MPNKRKSQKESSEDFQEESEEDFRQRKEDRIIQEFNFVPYLLLILFHKIWRFFTRDQKLKENITQFLDRCEYLRSIDIIPFDPPRKKIRLIKRATMKEFYR